MFNSVQKSIQRMRYMFSMMQRQAAVIRKRKQAETERSSAALELLLDDIAAETGLPLTQENLPIFALYAKNIIDERLQARQPEETWDGESFL